MSRSQSWSQVFFDNSSRDLMTINAIIRRFSGCYLPENNPEREDISLLAVLKPSNHFRSHPLVSSDLCSHLLRLLPCPSKVSKFSVAGSIENDVETLQISMKNGRIVTRVKIEDSLSNVHGHSLSVVPLEVD